MVYILPDQIWIVVLGFIISFALALGVGANDVANSFGTAVGAKVLTLRQACILAAIFETLGAVLLGGKVSETIQNEIVNISIYHNQTSLLLIGRLSTLSGSCLWQVIATAFGFPVSGTHSIVGATLGFTFVAKGLNGIKWPQIGFIVLSWFISPLLAGIVSVLIFFICKKIILIKKKPLEPGLRMLPIFYGCTIVINLFLIFHEGPKLLGFHKIPLWGTFIISFGVGAITAIFIRIFFVRWVRKKIINELNPELSSKDSTSADDYKTASLPDPKSTSNMYSQQEQTVEGNANTNKEMTILKKHEDDKNHKSEKEVDMSSKVNDKTETIQLFSFLQILTSIFGSFAHGGNDVSNAIGPLVSIWLVATTMTVLPGKEAPIWILFYGGVGISIGFWIWGRRIIKTLGSDLSKVTPSSGFCIEIGSALTVLVASKIGLPISSTHCKVGAVVAVGRFRARENVNWSLFRNIGLAWVLTLPLSVGFSAVFMALLQLAI